MWAATCDALHQHGGFLVAAGLPLVPLLLPEHLEHLAATALEDVTAGVGLMLQDLLDDTQRCSWLITCYLSAVESSGTAQQQCAAQAGREQAAAAVLTGSGLMPAHLLPAPMLFSHTYAQLQHSFTCAKALGVAFVDKLATAASPAAPAPLSAPPLAVPQRQAVLTTLLSTCSTLDAALHSARADQQAALRTRPEGSMWLLPAAAMLCTTGLLEGLVQHLRSLPAHKQQAQLQDLWPAMCKLATSVQVALAWACQRIMGPAPHQGHSQQDTQHAAAGSILLWAVGHCYARLRTSPGTAALLPQLLPPGPAAAFLPVVVLQTLTEHALSVGSLLQLAACAAPTSVAQGWLVAHAQSQVVRDVPVLAKCILDDLRTAAAAQKPLESAAATDAEGRQKLPVAPAAAAMLASLRHAAATAHAQYSALVLTATPEWLAQAVGQGNLLRDQQDKLYVCVASIAQTLADVMGVPAVPGQASSSSASQAGQAVDTAAAAALLLTTLSEVHYCRVPQLPLSKDLPARLIQASAAGPRGCEVLLQGLPCYEQLIAAVQLPTSARPCVRWQADAVAASKLLLLLPAAVACLPHAKDVSTAATRLLPYPFLIMRHPQEPVSTAGHGMVGSILQVLGDNKLYDMAESAAAYYVQRALQQPWMPGQIEGLEKSLSLVLGGLPGGRAVVRQCVDELAQAAGSWLQGSPTDPEPVPDFTPLFTAPPGSAQGPQATAEPKVQVPAGVRLLNVVLTLPLLVDWLNVPHATHAIEAMVQAAANPLAKSKLLQHLGDVLLRSNDYSRKVPLAHWFQELLATARVNRATKPKLNAGQYAVLLAE